MTRSWTLLLTIVLCGLPACRNSGSPEGAQKAPEEESWSVTAWSGSYEVFAETKPLVAGREALSHAHFTYLPDFSAVNEGTVTGVLRGPDGREESFIAEKPLRPGIFNVPFKPVREGVYDLSFRVRNLKASEEIACGRVQVGSASSPGGLAEPPPGTPTTESISAGQPVAFLKEQQWRTEFATEWARTGTVGQGLRAPGTVRPAGGGEATVTAPADGIVTAARWPYPGMEVGRGAPLFLLTPRIAADRSVAELQAEVTGLEAELEAAQARLTRLRDLLAVEAASRRDVEEAEARAKALSARLEAARRERAATAAMRGGASGPESFHIASPIAGRVAEVAVSPGQFVAAGTALGRLVRTSPVWLELALQPDQAGALAEAPSGLAVRRWAAEEPFLIPAADLRLVSRAPEIDAQTGAVPVIVEVRRSVDLLRLGSRVEAELLLPRRLSGITIPASALVDDSGVEVVYVQLEGESFDRREVTVAARQGGIALVRGIAAGERIVTRGGNAIRRSSLLGSGAVEGHVH